jgi:hypothetical protein
VSDFGLSLCVDPGETHVSSVHAGTLTHMAPELLMHPDHHAAVLGCRCLALASAGVSKSAAAHSVSCCCTVANPAVLQVSDFGLSLCVDPGETHVSSVHAASTAHAHAAAAAGAAAARRCLTLASACVWTPVRLMCPACMLAR